MNKINIDLGPNKYSILIENNHLVKTFNKEIKKLNVSKIFFVIDRKVNSLHTDLIQELFSSITPGYKKIILSSTEKNKSHKGLNTIYKKMLANNFGRDTVVVAIGGGIVGDLAGYAAATYMRGIPFIQVPTTLLACVDSSVGGKTGINYETTKNIIGAFHQPKSVIIDTCFLKTLPKEEIICGVGEIIKYGFLSDEKLLREIYNNLNSIFRVDEKFITRLIKKSVQLKASVVAEDEKELQLRKILNLGHTFAHAFESVFSHKIKHGQAVIAGIISALFLSIEESLIHKEKALAHIQNLLVFKKYLKMPSPDLSNLLSVMSKDKKNKSGKINFVLLHEVGYVVLDYNARKSNVLKSIKSTLKILS